MSVRLCAHQSRITISYGVIGYEVLLMKCHASWLFHVHGCWGQPEMMDVVYGCMMYVGVVCGCWGACDVCGYGMWVLGCVLDIFNLATTKDRLLLAGSGLLFRARHAVSHSISYAIALLAGLQILINFVRTSARSHPLRSLPPSLK